MNVLRLISQLIGIETLRLTVTKSFGQKRTYSKLIFAHGFFSIHSKVVQNAIPFLK